jgi:hypothetical protein
MNKINLNQELKNFFENFPLYKKFKFSVSFGEYLSKYCFKYSELDKLYLNFLCKKCNRNQTYKLIKRHKGHFGLYPPLQDSNIYRFTFYCTGCEEDFHEFFIEEESENINKSEIISDISVILKKIGQSPPHNIDIDQHLERILDYRNLTDFFKKGLISESQSYGLGAYVYYRRVLEEIIDDILDSIKNILEAEEKEEYLNDLEKIKNSKITEDKIKIAEKFIPCSLKPNGLNPLKIIYSSLSEGIHIKTEEECLEKAIAIRESMIFLIKKISEKNIEKEENKNYIDIIKKI